MQSVSTSRPKRVRAFNWTAFVPYLLSLPALALLALLFLYPILKMVVLTFIDSRAEAGFPLTLGRYLSVLSDGFYLRMLWRTVKVAGLATLITLALGFPVALYMRLVSSRARALLSLVLLSPLLMSVVVRTLGWVILLAPRGVINTFLLSVGVQPVKMIYNEAAIIMGLTHVYFGYMVLSLMTSILKIDESLLMAASNLGASRWQIFRQIILPLSLPGVLAGSVLVFTLSASAYVTPSLLGGNSTKTFPMRIYEQAVVNLKWEDAAVFATILFVVILVVVYVLSAWMESGKRRGIFR